MAKEEKKKKEGVKDESQETTETTEEGTQPNEGEPGDSEQKATEGEGGENPPVGNKPGPKPKTDGFRAECYKKIDKGITHKTEMVVVKQRHRLSDGTNIFPGDTFQANKMNAKVIRTAMDNYWIVPVKHAPEEDEKKSKWLLRMAGIYEVEADTDTAACKKK